VPGPVNTQIVSNSRATQPATQATAAEAKASEIVLSQVNAFLSAGADPVEVGEMVLDAIRENRLYIHTDRIMAEFIEARAKALLDAMPPAK